ncbi:YceI family protein [Helicobacter bizzozeronii]|uniref:YceI family protein n=1 Tax=Helicobacter bizzozeronii TaxID=56877 RepID=UPI000CEE196B|nr:YceI family protein [Helicobacter bizzozeronii]GMB92378.1 Polyisoprenoid-binding protein [Helicobacter bizzozeronii]
MKKFAIAALLASALLQANSLDTTKVSMSFTAFKTAKKVGVEGTFDHVLYRFNKDTSSVAHMLDKATATINVAQVNLHDETKTKNVKEAFFDQFKDQSLKVTFRNVVAGENQGTLLASVRMNGKSVKVPMSYTIKDKELVATGVLDIMEFGLKEAFHKLAAACSAQHEKLTWSQVQITFKAGLKD